jgi:hypothetical protein
MHMRLCGGWRRLRATDRAGGNAAIASARIAVIKKAANAAPC